MNKNLIILLFLFFTNNALSGWNPIKDIKGVLDSSVKKAVTNIDRDLIKINNKALNNAVLKEELLLLSRERKNELNTIQLKIEELYYQTSISLTDLATTNLAGWK